MVPILYPRFKDRTLNTPMSFANGDFHTNGIGRLTGTIEATVTEERNGAYELTMDILVGSPAAAFIEIGSMIGVKTHNDIDKIYNIATGTLDRQIFEVYNIDKSIDGHIVVDAKHYTYRASYIPIKEFTLASATLNALKNNFNSSSFRLETGSDITLVLDLESPATTKTAKYEQKVPRSLKKCLSNETGCILDLFNTKDSSLAENQKIDLEYEWDNNKIIIHSHRGTNRGAEIRAGKNVTDLKVSDDYTNAATGVLPYWTDGKTVVKGAVQYAANVADFPYHLTQVKDFTSDFKKKPSVTELNNKAQEYLKKKQDEIQPEINLSINYVDLRQTLGPLEMSQYEKIKLCDTVKVLYPSVGVSYTAKVTKIKWNVLAERIEEIEVGQPKASFSASVASTLDYTNVDGIVDIEGRQAVINEEQSDINDQTQEDISELDGRITGNEENIDGLDTSLQELSSELSEHDVTIQKVNTYFQFGDDGLTILTDATSYKTKYTHNGFVIYDPNGKEVAKATADEFNCVSGLGIKDWHFDIDIDSTGQTSILTLYRKREG